MKTPATSKQPKRTDSEQNVYAGVYQVLFAGMLVSTGMFIVGIVTALQRPEFIPLTPEWIKQHYHWSAIVRGIASFDPTVIMMIATVLLILTPVARVVVSIYAFAVDRDYKFVVITSIVLFVMGVAVVLGLFGLK